MASKIVFLGVCALIFTTVSCLTLDGYVSYKDNNDGKEKTKVIVESLKEFVNMVDTYNLNVSVIGSQKKYSSDGWVKKDISLNIRMPVNTVHLTQATLDDDKQANYLKNITNVTGKGIVGAKTRVIKIENGEDKLQDEHQINKLHLIDSPTYKALTAVKNGVQGFSIPENSTNRILYNYIIDDPSSSVKKIQVLTGNVVITEVEVSGLFPKNILRAAKDVLPRLWFSIDKPNLLATLLIKELEEGIEQNHEAIIGANNFSLYGKTFANLKVGETKVLIIYDLDIW